MAEHDKYYTGSTNSRHLVVGDRSWDGAVFQSGKPVLDSELVLNAEITQEVRNLLSQKSITSGWLRGPLEDTNTFPTSLRSGLGFPAVGDPLYVANSFLMQKRTAWVAGSPVVVEFSTMATAGLNRIQLSSAPVFGGAPPDVKRSDFVFLEVWKAMVSSSPHAMSSITISTNPTGAGDNFNIAGNTLTGVLAAPGVDEYLVGGSDALTAANMASAINASPPNSFTNVTAYAVGSVLYIRAVAAGTAGNGLPVAVSASGGGGVYVVSGVTTGGVDEANKPTQDTLYRHGNVQADASTNLNDDIEDPLVGVESTKRVQVQYRIRVTGQSEAVNFKTESDGFSNVSVLAQGTQAAPVATYRFVRADGATVSGSSSAASYGVVDDGLWVAGDGSQASATALGSVDGYVYALPLCFVFRRNDASGGSGFDPINNTNGGLSGTHLGFVHPLFGLIPAGVSDRPDGAFHDVIQDIDVQDLRKSCVPAGMDWTAELNRQMQYLMDGTLGTWAIDAADKQTLGSGSGSVGVQFLVCNEVGRSAADGGVAPGSGDTNRGVTIGSFDHIRRRFADHPVVERVLLALYPTDTVLNEPGKHNTPAIPGNTTWTVGDTINIDLGSLNASTLGSFADASKSWASTSASVANFWPVGTTITDVLNVAHDDGHHTTAVPQVVQLASVTGLGTDYVQLVLDANPDLVNGGDNGTPNYQMVSDTALNNGSPRRIFVELEITYPVGSGTTDTPDVLLTPDPTPYPSGPVVENNTTQRPLDWENLLPPQFREGKRELSLEYVANDGSGVGAGTPITESFVSSDNANIYLSRRIFGSGATLTSVTDISTLGAGQAHDVDASVTEYGSSTRKLVLDTSGATAAKQPLSGAGQTLVSVDFFAQDALPNYGTIGGGYQVSVYYRTNAPQTLGVQAGVPSLPATMTVQPLAMDQSLWTGTVGSGSMDVPFPYTAPMDQIPVNGNTPVNDYPGEWCFSATADISVGDFSTSTGLLHLHAMMPVDGTNTFTFSSPDSDVEFRSHYKVADPTAYRPTVFAQPLSTSSTHKVWMPFLAVATEDTALWRKNEVLLLVITRFALMDADNTIRFLDTTNRSCVGVYRTRGVLMLARG